MFIDYITQKCRKLSRRQRYIPYLRDTNGIYRYTYRGGTRAPPLILFHDASKYISHKRHCYYDEYFSVYALFVLLMYMMALFQSTYSHIL